MPCRLRLQLHHLIWESIPCTMYGHVVICRISRCTHNVAICLSQHQLLLSSIVKFHMGHKICIYSTWTGSYLFVIRQFVLLVKPFIFFFSEGNVLGPLKFAPFFISYELTGQKKTGWSIGDEMLFVRYINAKMTGHIDVKHLYLYR